ncbi:hypothetical protein SASPL_117741 [Salvia splendens]|uniref:AP2/ERF domain-containing protein n=1 Tax=Salvia splendens TaxID=180675 RepID=A0A8X8XVI6_SALSN|nr:hypothetical protein SASPL_117741 [Salvia splendens]
MVQREGREVEQVLLKWLDYPIDDATWMDVEDVRGQFPYFRLVDKAVCTPEAVDNGGSKWKVYKRGHRNVIDWNEDMQEVANSHKSTNEIQRRGLSKGRLLGYPNGHRVWLGTFNSEKDAAVAYDRASMKLRSSKMSSSCSWIVFAKEKGLRSRDRVIFYSYESGDQKFCILDAAYAENRARDGLVVDEDDEELETEKPGDETDRIELENVQDKENEPSLSSKGFKLFGVKIMDFIARLVNLPFL